MKIKTKSGKDGNQDSPEDTNAPTANNHPIGEIESEAQVFLIDEENSSSIFSLDPCLCDRSEREEDESERAESIPEFVSTTVPFVKHSRAISLPSSAIHPFELEKSASFGQSMRNAFLRDSIGTVATASIGGTVQTGGTLALDTFVRASSYHELGQSPAVTFLGEIAELTAPQTGAKNGSMLPAPFQQVDGYVFVREISSGTFSECWLGHPVGNASHLVAIKVFLSASRDAMREIGLWSTFDHPNILPLLDCFAVPSAESIGTIEGHPQAPMARKPVPEETGNAQKQPTRWYAVSPLIAHGSLLTTMNRYGVLPLSRGRHIFRQVARGLQYLHNECRVVHGDVKLENVLIDRDDRVFLCDFGLCQRYGTPSSNQTDDSLEGSGVGGSQTREPLPSTPWHCTGSLQYCAPELLKLAQSVPAQPTRPFEVARKSDCWSLGIILYALVRGEFPFGDEFVPRLKISIEEGKFEKTGNDLIDDLLEHMLCVNPDQRWGCDQILQHTWVKLE